MLLGACDLSALAAFANCAVAYLRWIRSMMSVLYSGSLSWCSGAAPPACQNARSGARKSAQSNLRSCRPSWWSASCCPPPRRRSMSERTISSPSASLLVVGGVGKGQRQNAGVDEVCRVDAGKALGDDRLDAEVEGRERRVLARRALPVVRAAHDHALAELPWRGAGNSGSQTLKAVLGDFRNVGAAEAGSLRLRA